MSLTASKNFETGKEAPDFKLPNTTDDQYYELNELKGKKGTALFFICNHCPFVVHVNKELIKIANEYLPKGVAFIAISSNDSNYYPQDGPFYMKQVAQNLGYPFPYLYDETQLVATAYNAACTPDFYLFDSDLKAVYHGQLDDSRPGNGQPVSGKDFRNALDLVLNNTVNNSKQKPSIGCSIKWK